MSSKTKMHTVLIVQFHAFSNSFLDGLTMHSILFLCSTSLYCWKHFMIYLIFGRGEIGYRYSNPLQARMGTRSNESNSDWLVHITRLNNARWQPKHGSFITHRCVNNKCHLLLRRHFLLFQFRAFSIINYDRHELRFPCTLPNVL